MFAYHRPKNIRIFDAYLEVLTALKDVSARVDRAMSGWIKENVQPFLPGTFIRGIAFGNVILGSKDNLDLREAALLPAAKNVYNALYRLNLTKVVRVQSSHSQAVFANSIHPSPCTCREDILPYMTPLLQFLISLIGSPIFINVYPFLAYMSDPKHNDLKYDLFQLNPGIYDAKTKLNSNNMFDAQVDAHANG